MRVQLDLDREAVEFLDTMMARAGVRSRSEILRHSLALLYWAIEKREQGYSIMAVKEGSDVAKELSMPALDQIVRVTESAKAR